MNTLNAILTVASLTLREALRRRVVLAGLLFGLAFLAFFAFGLSEIWRVARSGQEGSSLGNEIGRTFENPQARGLAAETLVMLGLYAVNFLTVAMAVLLPVDTLSGEVQSGSIQTLVTKPTARHGIVLGKWLGHFGLIAAYLLLTAGGVLVIGWAVTGVSMNNIPAAAGLMILQAMVMLSVSIAGGSRLSTLANGVMCFGLFGLGMIGGWIEQIGVTINNDQARNIGIISSLLIPGDALWRMASSLLPSPLFRELPLGPFMNVSTPSTAMVVWAALYTLGAMFVAVRGFASRDL
jgi:Cu-processing system permease protein